ncbi:MAG: SRPBCC family protein, partial [Deltaproteobacteria bacterium]|nr:SRPBCC family protein [Deltaproteobacteria bacterium]
MLKKILAVLGTVLAVILVTAALRPSQYEVSRSAVAHAPAAVVYAQLDDFSAWAAWSPWEKLDPGMKKEHGGTPRRVGATYTWSGNDDVGSGKMTIVRREAPALLGIRLEFIAPFAAVADTEFQVTDTGADAVQITWTMRGTNDFVGKVFGLFMDMDSAIGKDFERGLGDLVKVSEQRAGEELAV